MPEAPEKIALRWETGAAVTNGQLMTHPDYTQFVRADLCADPALLAEAVEVLRKLRHAVCGETGFAACVRLDSGKAYPWPALDDADEAARAFIAKWENRHDR